MSNIDCCYCSPHVEKKVNINFLKKKNQNCLLMSVFGMFRDNWSTKCVYNTSSVELLKKITVSFLQMFSSMLWLKSSRNLFKVLSDPKGLNWKGGELFPFLCFALILACGISHNSICSVCSSVLLKMQWFIHLLNCVIVCSVYWET